MMLNLGSFLIFLKSCMSTFLSLMIFSQMPMYAKFLKDHLSKKRKIDEHKTIALGDERSAMVITKLPVKLKDPNSFSLP